MIEVKNLTKIYKKGKREVKALDDISFTLANKGLVFILGKSGSGKSTLLNILGGLDSLTSGQIISSGKDITKFNKKDFDKYRNSYIGFVFQEFYLLDQLTLKENVKLSLDISNIDDDKSIETSIEKVGLKGLEHRYMYELSGGQKQRVAIARAIAKQSHIILADEPTGNLDSKSAIQILDLLKEISKDRLVVVVSHNIESANTYADRIIELADGKIIRDEQRENNYINELNIDNGIVTLPYCKELNDKELNDINDNLKEGKIKEVKQLGSGFKSSLLIKENDEEMNLKNANMKLSKSMSLSFKFFNKRKYAGLFTVFINVLLIFILGLTQFFVMYDTKDTINSLMEESEKSFILYKGKYIDEQETKVSINEPVRSSVDDYQAFINSDYEGGIYPLYNFSLTTKLTQLEHEQALNDNSNLLGFYIKETYGTLQVDEEYLIKIFGVDNKVKVLAGDLVDKPYGIIITDYVADSIMYYFPEKYLSYEDILGNYIPYTGMRNYINAIIYTGYKDKYGEYIEEYIKECEEIAAKQRIWVSDQEKVKELWDYIKTYIGINYTLNPNFGDVVISKESRDFVSMNYVTYTFENGTTIYSDTNDAYIDSRLDYDLTGNKAMVGLNLYNKWFGTQYSQTDDIEFTPFKLRIDKYEKLNSLKKGDPMYSVEIEVVDISVDSVGIDTLFLSEEVFMNFKKNQVFVYAYYFEDIKTVGNVYQVANENLFVSKSINYNNAINVSNIVNVFEDFMVLITIVLCVIAIFILSNYGFGNIKKHKYEIGVMFSLGANSKTIIKVFLTQILFIGLLIAIFSGLSLFILTEKVNDLIMNSLSTYINWPSLSLITILNFSFSMVIIDLLLVIVITFLSAIIPTIYLRNIKPINIIKTKE